MAASSEALRAPARARPRCASGRTRCSISRSDGRVDGWAVDLVRLDAAAELHRRGDARALSRPRHPLPRPLAPFRRRRARICRRGRSRRRGRARRSTSSSSRSCSTPAPGPDWRYRDPASGTTFSRSEGLAVASQRLFEAGAFSADPASPLRADGAALAGLDGRALAAGFQVERRQPAGRARRPGRPAPPPRRAGAGAAGPVRDARTRRGRAASTTCSPPAPRAAGCRRRRSSSCCSRRSARSGRTGW